jgi:hypothetical protein
MSAKKEPSFDIYFYPRDPSEAGFQAQEDWYKGPKYEKIYLITAIAKKLKESLVNSGIPKWDISVKGYVEASTGALPGGKFGFEATLTLSSQ